MDDFVVTMSFAVPVNADNEDEAKEKAREIIELLTIDDLLKDCNLDVEYN